MCNGKLHHYFVVVYSHIELGYFIIFTISFQRSPKIVYIQFHYFSQLFLLLVVIINNEILNLAIKVNGRCLNFYI